VLSKILYPGAGRRYTDRRLLILLYGEAYAASAFILRALIGVMATRCMTVPLQLLLSRRIYISGASGLGVAAAARLGRNALLIPRCGAHGAAWSTPLSGVLLITRHAASAYGRREFINAFALSLIAVSAFIIALLVSGFVRGDEFRFVLRSVVPKGSR
jgi:O-antigen/teichoic acid export membrane protein